MNRRKSKGEYLAFLTVKYDIHPDLLFCALLSAGEIGVAKCGPLTVEYRGKIKDKIYYLIKEGSNVVAQFPISEEFLERQRNPIRNFMESNMVRKFKSEEPEKPFYTKIEDLKIGRTHLNLKAEVKEVSKTQYVNTQFGNRIRLAKALLKDETGEINLCLWKEQVNSVLPGNNIQISNASVKKFRGTKQLTLGNNGSIKIISDFEAEPTLCLSETQS